MSTIFGSIIRVKGNKQDAIDGVFCDSGASEYYNYDCARKRDDKCVFRSATRKTIELSCNY